MSTQYETALAKLAAIQDLPATPGLHGQAMVDVLLATSALAAVHASLSQVDAIRELTEAVKELRR